MKDSRRLAETGHTVQHSALARKSHSPKYAQLLQKQEDSSEPEEPWLMRS
jgi:hypothetical protein